MILRFGLTQVNHDAIVCMLIRRIRIVYFGIILYTVYIGTHNGK